MAAVILAAGLGRRFGGSHPKPLAEIRGGLTILANQVSTLARELPDAETLIVVGHRADRIEAAQPGVRTVCNPEFARSNTAFSLRVALDELPVDRDVLWVNGDLYFDAPTLRRLVDSGSESSRLLVNRGPVGAEEMKYTLDPGGFIQSISKANPPLNGESLGMHIVRSSDRPAFQEALEAAPMDAYFEDAINEAIAQRDLRLRPVDAGRAICMEIDTPRDLERLRRLLDQAP